MTRTLIAAAAALVLLAGCAGDNGGAGVATAGGTASASAGSDDGPNNDGGDPELLRRFAQCMRDNGIDMSDPETDGEGRVRFGRPGGADGPPPDRETFEAAQKACRQHLPNGGEPPKLSAEDVDRMRAFAKCMRDNGVAEFPDPQPDGALRIEARPGSGIDPGSETFKAAEKACEQYRPRRPGGGS
jgi:hypothetical protein